MKRRLFLKKGQSVLEFVTLTVIVMVAIMVMASYFRRGVQGRWRTATDDIGDQYDPFLAESDVTHRTTSETNMTLTTIDDGVGGMRTYREDATRSNSSKRGFLKVWEARP